MNKAIIFLSTRQLTQVNFSTLPLNGYDLLLIASKEEHFSLPSTISSCFSHKFTVSIEANDGVIIEYNTEEIFSIVKPIRNQYAEVDFVSFDEGCVELTDSLRQNIKNSENLERFRDKVTMKKWLKDKNVPIPLFLDTLPENSSFSEVCETVGLPFVIKPRRSAGSNNIYVIRNEKHFIQAKRSIGSLLSHYEAEQFIDAKLYHCDIALWQSKCIFSESTKYLSPTIDFQSGLPLGGIVMDLNCPLRSRLISFAKKTLAALDSKDGVYHMEVFAQNDEAQSLIFLEVGARPPGMLVTSMYEQATGINLLNLDIMIQTRSLSDTFKVSRLQDAFYLVYPKGKGKVQALSKPKLDDKLNVDFSSNATLGDNHNGCFSNLDFCAYIICSSNAKSLIDKAYEEMSRFKPIFYQTNLEA